MRKMTIAEMRKRELDKLETITNNNKIATNLMNRYYRLAAMEMRLLYLENTEYHHNKSYTLELIKKRDNTLDRLDKDLHKYGLMLIYYSHIPTITDHKGGNAVIDTFFYD